MYQMYGAQKLHVLYEKRIIKSKAVGTTTLAEVKWLSDNIIENATPWKEQGWVYVVGIGDMEPVSHEISVELIEFHKRLEAVGCKAIAFVDPDAFIIAFQAKKHQKKSKASYVEKHFRTEEEALEWAEKLLNE